MIINKYHITEGEEFGLWSHSAICRKNYKLSETSKTDLQVFSFKSFTTLLIHLFFKFSLKRYKAHSVI